MRWLFGENPDIHTFGNYLPAGKRNLCTPYDCWKKTAKSERRKKWD
jgi:hypothetical protein